MRAPGFRWVRSSEHTRAISRTLPGQGYPTISRIASYGGPTRELYRKNFQGDAEILSNIVADADFVYFTTADGLMRLSVNANHLWFQTTAVLQALRHEGSIPRPKGSEPELISRAIRFPAPEAY